MCLDCVWLDWSIEQYDTFVMRLIDASQGENAVRGVGVDVPHEERKDRHFHDTSLPNHDHHAIAKKRGV